MDADPHKAATRQLKELGMVHETHHRFVPWVCMTPPSLAARAPYRQAAVAQTFLSAGSRDFPVPYSRSGTGDWKVARTRRLESLRHNAHRSFVFHHFFRRLFQIIFRHGA